MMVWSYNPWYGPVSVMLSSKFVQNISQTIAMSVTMFMLTPAVACHRELSAAEITQRASATATGFDDKVPVAAQFDETAFALKIEPKASYDVGKPDTLVVVLKAKNPHHVNQEYPHKLKLRVTEGITYPQPVLGREAMTIGPMLVEMTVPFTATRSGTLNVGGEFAFSLCTADRCLIEKRSLATVIKVQ